MPLTDKKCHMVRPSPKIQKLSDGGGLQLWIQPTDSRLWRFAYRFDGKQILADIEIRLNDQIIKRFQSVIGSDGVAGTVDHMKNKNAIAFYPIQYQT